MCLLGQHKNSRTQSSGLQEMVCEGKKWDRALVSICPSSVAPGEGTVAPLERKIHALPVVAFQLGGLLGSLCYSVPHIYSTEK